MDQFWHLNRLEPLNISTIQPASVVNSNTGNNGSYHVTKKCDNLYDVGVKELTYCACLNSWGGSVV